MTNHEITMVMISISAGFVAWLIGQSERRLHKRIDQLTEALNRFEKATRGDRVTRWYEE